MKYKCLIFFVLIQCFLLSEGKRTKKVENYGLCTANQYRCRNEQCVSKSSFCNGVNDCVDNTDESYCFNMYHSSCPSHYSFFRCSNGYRCIPLLWKCDGHVDCQDSSDERNCLDDVESIPGSIIARNSAEKWLRNLRHNVTGTKKWGIYAPRIAIALYLANSGYFNGSNATGNELAYEIDNEVLLGILRSKQESVSMNELASYIHALIISCQNPRDFHGTNLISKLRDQVDKQENYTSPLVILALCNARDKIYQRDVDKLTYAFDLKERPNWRSSQALALIALSCVSKHPNAPKINSSLITEMSLHLKKNQFNNGSFENLYTTALVMQAIFASGKEDDDAWDMDEAVKFLVKNQNSDGSYGTVLSTYFVLPVLHYKTLLNISSSHCNNNNIPDTVDNLNKKVGKKILVKYSIWFGDKLDLVRSLIIRMVENSTFFDVMNTAQALDDNFQFESNFLDGKPYIFSLGGYQDDPENEKFWFLYRANSTKFVYDHVNLSPVDVIPEDEEEFVMWYKSAHWATQNFATLFENASLTKYIINKE